MKIPTKDRLVRALSPPGLGRVIVALLFAGFTAAACDVHSPTGPGTLASITVTPNPTLSITTTQQFVAVGKDAEGTDVTISPTWSIVAGGGAISSAGLFTAGMTPGTFTATVKAASGTMSGTATVTVVLGTLATITVTPSPDTLPINGTRQFVAVGRDAGNNVLSITPTWSVVASGGAINSTGVFTAGVLPGTYAGTVRASSGTVNGNATVTVIPGVLATIVVSPNPDTLDANDTQLFTAVGRDAGNNILTIIPAWSVFAGGGAINGGTGLFTAGAVAGSFLNTVRATSGLIFGSATVVVNVPPLVILDQNGIMAGTAFTCITGGLISSDISISPGSTVTGFPPCVITGVQHLADAVALNAQNGLTTAYNTLMGLPCPPANAIVADLGGTTMSPGVYCTAIGIGITGPLTLDGGGDPNANFVFQAGSSITTAGDVLLINGAQAKNVYWVAGSSVTLGTASQWKGNALALTSITLVDNANLIGRALARNGAVSLGTNNTITLP